MREYHKIETIYEREMNGTKKLIPGKYRNKTIEFLKDCYWVWTEKVDGTNIRVYWDGAVVTFGGRTDRASIPAPLVNRLMELFGGDKNEQIFEQMFGDSEVILFGEGYGKKIQSVGSGYNPDGVDFIMFDVMIDGKYQPRGRVEEIAQAFGTKVVPIVGAGTLEQAVEYVRTKPMSILSQSVMMEGVVCRPGMGLLDRCGNRVIVKIKCRDFD